MAQQLSTLVASGGARLLSQHSGSRGRQISVSLRPSWSTRASSRTGPKAIEKPCLENPKQNKQNPKTLWSLDQQYQHYLDLIWNLGLGRWLSA